MAIATLINPMEVEDGGTAWTIDTYPFDAAPFAGPAERHWDGFRVVDDGAEFHWRTGADRVRHCAERVKAGEWLPARALEDPAVQRWLDANAAELADLLFEEDPSAEDLDDDELNKRLLTEFGSGVSNEEGAFGYHMRDDDAYLRDAAEALELPPWARVWLHDEGGPGTGFTAAAIVLDDGKSLGDLAAWLDGRK